MNRANQIGLVVAGVALGATLVAMGVQLTSTEAPAPTAPARPAAKAKAKSKAKAEPTPTPPPFADRQTDQPNIVMIVACTLRQDMLTPYGGPEAASPFVAHMADNGALFEHAIDAAPWTKAASTALMTGYHPVQLGMTEPADHANRRRLSSEVTTLAEYLDDAGYETLGITSNPNTSDTFGFHQGFDAYSQPNKLWGQPGGTTKPTLRQLVDRALPRLDAREDPSAPLYLRIMTIDVHEPIKATAFKTAPFEDLGLPPRVVAYLAMVRQLDTGMRHLWTELNARGYTEENTVLVLVNDHGEGLRWPDVHGHGHGNHVQSTTVRMPWVLYGEGVAAGHRVGGMASQVDVLPTLLGLAGADTDYAGPGRDWSAQVRGEAPRTDRVSAYADTWFQKSSRAGVYTETTACLHDFLDLAEQMGQERLLPRTACFDRVADPLQTQPVDLDQGLLDELMAWREARVADNEAWPHHEDIRVDDDLAAQLEALGYAQGDDLGDEPAHVAPPASKAKAKGKGKGKAKGKRGKGKRSKGKRR